MLSRSVKIEDSVIKHLSDVGGEGYSDGESASARFMKPRGFVVNQKGKVFIADRSNNVIRKISADFNLAFDLEKCAILVSDHGNQLVRLISLKSEDCTKSSPPSGLGSVPLWILGLVLSCSAGILVGLVVRPCISPFTGGQQPVRLQRDMEAMPNQSGEASTGIF